MGVERVRAMRGTGLTAWLAGLLVLAGMTAALTGAAAPAPAGAVTEVFPKVSPAQVAAWQERGEAFLFVDTRPKLQYDLRHARGAVTIPSFAIVTTPLPRGTKVVLYDGGAGSTEAEDAARALRVRGQTEFYLLEGGLTAWEGQGLPIVAPPGKSAGPLVDPIGAEELARLIAAGARLTILDVRSAAAYKEGHLPGAVSAATPALLEQAAVRQKVPDLIVVYDDGNGDARTQAEQLRRKGFRAVKYLHGGMLAWNQAKLKEEK